MTKQEVIQVLQSIEDRAIDFPNMTECDWVAISAAKRHLTEEPVSEDLEEAAMQYAKSKHKGEVLQEIVSWDFQAGAKWQRKQGKTKEATIGLATNEVVISIKEDTLDELGLCAGDKIIIQIRKKED